jgi:aminopeptidase N
LRLALIIILFACSPAFAVEPFFCEKPGSILLSTDAPDTSSRGMDVLHYDIEIDVDIDNESIIGKVSTSLNLLDNRSLLFDLVSNMTVDSLKWNNSPVLWEHSGDSLLVTQPVPYQTGSVTIDTWYHGEPQRHGALNVGMLFRRHGDSQANPDGDGPAIFTISEPWTAHSWWPCKDHPSDKATVTVSSTVADTLVMVSNGLLVEEIAMGNQVKYKWQEDYLISTYLVAMNISDYTQWDEMCGDLPLTFHIYPGHAENAHFDLEPTCQMMNLITEMCGEYPFSEERYGQVEVDWGGAMEHQTATSLGSWTLPGTGVRQKVIIHELAHQWFGNLLTPAQWRDIWLNEGFARYFEALWVEETEGYQSYLDYLNYIGPSNHPDLFTDMGILTDPAPILPNLLIYDKGAWLLHTLRFAIGDNRFFDFLFNYAHDPTYAYGHVTTADFIRHAEAAANRDLSKLLNPWLYTDAAPEIQIEKNSWPDNSGTRIEITATQNHRQLFELHIPVRQYGSVGEMTHTIQFSSISTTNRWTYPGKLDSLIIDPDHEVLAFWGKSYEPELRLQPPSPNPSSTNGVDFSYAATLENLTASVYDSRGKLINEFNVPAGNRFHFNNKDSNGKPLPAGRYWLRIQPTGTTASFTVIN